MVLITTTDGYSTTEVYTRSELNLKVYEDMPYALKVTIRNESRLYTVLKVESTSSLMNQAFRPARRSNKAPLRTCPGTPSVAQGLLWISIRSGLKLSSRRCRKHIHTCPNTSPRSDLGIRKKAPSKRKHRRA